MGDSGKVHSCKAYRATVLRTVCSTDSVRRVVISSGFRPESSLGVLLLPHAVLWVNGRSGGPGCGQQLSTSTLDSYESYKCMHAYTDTHKPRKVFLEKSLCRQISRKHSVFLMADMFLNFFYKLKKFHMEVIR